MEIVWCIGIARIASRQGNWDGSDGIGVCTGPGRSTAARSMGLMAWWDTLGLGGGVQVDFF